MLAHALVHAPRFAYAHARALAPAAPGTTTHPAFLKTSSTLHMRFPCRLSAAHRAWPLVALSR
eukprot:6182418-Pleurochrysis_carterae.AAC.2